VDIAGAADMTLGLEFFCTTMELPEGNVDLLEYCMAGANKEVEPDAEERKGGSGHIGKMLLSAGNTHLALVAYVPTELIPKIKANQWLAEVASKVGGEIVGCATEGYARATVKADPDNDKFAIKDKDVALEAAFTYLKERECFPEDNDDDDDYCYGDDAFDEFND